MDLRLIRSFLAVAECGSVTRAAADLFVTQPALSRRLRQLEEELGASLLDRSRRGVALTEHGRFVEREGRALVERWERMKDGVGALSRLEAGTVRVGGGATAVSFLLPRPSPTSSARTPGCSSRSRRPAAGTWSATWSASGWSWAS